MLGPSYDGTCGFHKTLLCLYNNKFPFFLKLFLLLAATVLINTVLYICMSLLSMYGHICACLVYMHTPTPKQIPPPHTHLHISHFGWESLHLLQLLLPPRAPVLMASSSYIKMAHAATPPRLCTFGVLYQNAFPLGSHSSSEVQLPYHLHQRASPSPTPSTCSALFLLPYQALLCTWVMIPPERWPHCLFTHPTSCAVGAP